MVEFKWAPQLVASTAVGKTSPSKPMAPIVLKNNTAPDKTIRVPKTIIKWVDKEGKQRQKTQTRGMPGAALLQRRLARYGEALKALGVKTGEVNESENIPGEANSDGKPWTERISDVLFGAQTEDHRQILRNFQREEETPRFAAFPMESDKAMHCKFDERSTMMVMEHLAKYPLAHLIEGMHGTLVRFKRNASTGPASTDTKRDPFYVVGLKSNEPSPTICTVEGDESMDCLVVNSLGLYSLASVDLDDTDYNTYVVTPKQENSKTSYHIHRMTHLFLASELEPTGLAPNADQCKTIQSQIVSKPDTIVSSKLCLYRSSMCYMKRVQATVGPALLQFDVLMVLEAYGLLYRMLKYAQDADIAVRGEPTVNAKLLVALREIFNKLETSPWYRTFSFYWLFHNVAGGRNPFKLKTARMRVVGIGDATSKGYLSSYLPKKILNTTPDETDFKTYEEETETNDPKKNSRDAARRQHRARKRKSASNPPKQAKQQKLSAALDAATLALNRQTNENNETYDLEAEEAENDADAFSRFNETSTKKKKSTVAKRGRTKIFETGRDGRVHTEAELDAWLIRLNFIPPSDMGRWDKLWFLQKVASSEEIGRFILNGEIWHLNRNEQKAQKSAQQTGKDESMDSKITVERMEFFRQFRQSVRTIWNRFVTLARRRTSTTTTTTTTTENESDDDLLEFANVLDNIIFKKQETGIVHFDKNEAFHVYAERLSTEMNARAMHREWHEEREKERRLHPVGFLVRRKIMLRYLDRGRVTSTNVRIHVMYDMYPAHRLPKLPVAETTSDYPMEVPEEEIIIEE
jgi:hypothetical protein